MNTEAFTKYESEVRSYCRHFPVIFKKAKDAYFIDENNEKYIGFNGRVLIEGCDDKEQPVAFGKFSNFKMVYFPGDRDLVGSYRTVTVTEIRKNSLFGRLEGAETE